MPKGLTALECLLSTHLPWGNLGGAAPLVTQWSQGLQDRLCGGVGGDGWKRED